MLHAYIRTMVQFYMLAIFSSLSAHFTLPIHMHPGTGKHVIFTLLRNWIGFCHGQILIEAATHSYNICREESMTWHIHIMVLQ